MEQTTLKNKLIKFLQEEKKEIKDFVIKFETEKNIEHKIDGHELDDDIPPTSQYFPTSSQTEISDEEIEKGAKEYTCKEYDRLIFDYENYDTYNDFVNGAKWYREQLKTKQ